MTAWAATVERRDAWATRERLRQAGGAQCPYRLVGRPCRSYVRGHRRPCVCMSSGWADHRSLWLDEDGRPALWLCQPYSFYGDHLPQVASLCEELGLHLTVSAGSWWYPGRTVALSFRRAAS